MLTDNADKFDIWMPHGSMSSNLNDGITITKALLNSNEFQPVLERRIYLIRDSIPNCDESLIRSKVKY